MSNPQVGSDGWPVGEKRYNCDNCPLSKDGKPDGVKCLRKKRVGIGFCRDLAALLASKGGN